MPSIREQICKWPNLVLGLAFMIRKWSFLSFLEMIISVISGNYCLSFLEMIVSVISLWGCWPTSRPLTDLKVVTELEATGRAWGHWPQHTAQKYMWSTMLILSLMGPQAHKTMGLFMIFAVWWCNICLDWFLNFHRRCEIAGSYTCVAPQATPQVKTSSKASLYLKPLPN